MNIQGFKSCTIYNVLNDQTEKINEVVQAANNGEFDGAKGDKGDTGAVGPQGPKGEKGETVEVVNSFEGGVDKALSAEKGKELNRRVEGLEKMTYIVKEYESESITATQSAENYVKDLAVKGRTLQNLYKNVYIKENSEQIWLNNDIEISSLQSGEITVINTTGLELRFGIYIKEPVNNTLTYKRLVISTTTVKITLAPGEFVYQISGYFSVGWKSTDKDKLLKCGYVLSGDWTNKEIPPYFEGIKSSCEAEGNKIMVKSTGKNLWNMEEIITNNPNIFKKGFDGDREIVEVGKTWGTIVNTDIKFKENTSYTLTYMSSTDSYGMFFIVNYTDGTKLETVYPSGNYEVCKLTTSSTKTIKEFRISSGNQGITKFDVRIQLEEGTIATDYEPYQEQKAEVQLPCPHRGIFDESNIYNGETGMYKEVINQIDLTGDLNIKLQSVNEYGIANFYIAIPSYKSNLKTISNRFVIQTGGIATITEEGFLLSNNTTLYIRIQSSKADTVEKFKTWLQANPTTFLYILAEPTVHNIEKLPPLSTYDGTTHITTDNELKPIIKAKVLTKAQAYYNSLDKENEISKKDNRTLAIILKSIVEPMIIPEEIEENTLILELNKIINR